MRGYAYGRNVKWQLDSGAGFTVRCLIVSNMLNINYSEVFPEIRSWKRSPHWHRPEDFWFLLMSFPMAGFVLMNPIGGRGDPS